MINFSRRGMFARNPIEEEDFEAAKLEKEGKSVFKLNKGDPPVYFPTPRYIINAYVKALREGETTYASSIGIRSLREAIAERYKRMYKINAAPEDIVVTQGVTEALQFINAALVNEGEYAFLFKPYYPLYVPSLEVYGGGKAIFGKYDESIGWGIDIDAAEKELKKSRGKKIKYMLITNPNNPTGTVLERRTLEAIADLANNHDLLLISDEIYDEIIYNGARFTSIGEVARGMPHVILNGFSKNYDATGLRLGYILVPEDDKYSRLLKEHFINFALFRLSPSVPAQYAFKEAISNIEEHKKSIRSMVSEIESRVNAATNKINNSEYMHAVEPNGAFYLFPKVDLKSLHMHSSKEFVDKLLKEEHVQLTRGSGFGEEGHVRIVGLPPKNELEMAIEKINKFCERHAKR